VGVDEAESSAYWVGWTDSPLEQHLYRVSLDGEEAGTDARAVRLTREPGWHEVVLSPDCAHYVDTFSHVMQPPQVHLCATEGVRVTTLEPNQLPERDAYAWVTPTFVELDAEDGTTLHPRLTLPPDRMDGEEACYPAIVKVYGGPHAQTVRNAWDATMVAQLFAQSGFVVLELDNRGMGNRGKAFATPLHLRMADVEVRDQLAGVTHLKGLTYVDPERIGVFGWSYGGYMVLMCMAQMPQLFRAGVAVAPVTDWRLYDTHYTERYLGHPAANPEGYAQSAVITHASKLQDKLLLVHGMADDNVLFQHSVLLMERLQRERIPFEMMAYPGKKHGISGKEVRVHLFDMVLAHFRRYLC